LTFINVHGSAFVPGTAFTAAAGAPDTSSATVGLVGRLYLSFADIAPVVTGFGRPHGIAFEKTQNDVDNSNTGECRAN
jgi:hypothetical protein